MEIATIFGVIIIKKMFFYEYLFTTLPLWVLVFLLSLSANLTAQDGDSLLDGIEEETTDYATASFKTTRVVNSHSLENKAKGTMDFKISHRFGLLNQGVYDIFGLDNATIRFGFEYGISDALMVGLGRSTFEKTYDGFIKYKFLRQSKGKRNMPITAAIALGSGINTLKPNIAFPTLTEDNIHFSHRLNYYAQLIVGRKFSSAFSAQLMPIWIHRNYAPVVNSFQEKNDIFSLGAAARMKLTKRMAVNVEYFYNLPDQLSNRSYNSLSIGFDIETGGHVFQLHFTNSQPMSEKGFIANTGGDWLDGKVHFGFNITREFTVVKPKRDH